ncbi:SPOR domain-containing protein [Salinisphaera japonica]|uniref:Sporulation protein n=1 Tax=Salinisphaera japonica YTM-1 TaxID=1209778 RepID=A0A423PYZ8_9GAMM|nr:SPOR domain-containing protein [Salinisphaera japonica]ROO30842.1 sporulation protein [Salinisphaera japonica YTM-1]
MARDYSSRHNGDAPKNTRAKTNRRNPPARPAKTKNPARAKNTATSNRAPRGRTPGWVWGLSGLFVGIVLISGYYIFARPAGTPGGTAEMNIALPTENTSNTASQSSADDQAAQQAKTPEKTTQPEEKPRFSFYKMLPNYHVDVSEGAHKSRAEAPAGHEPHEAEPATPAPTSRPAEPKRPAPSANGRAYVIQAGAFSTPADADRRKAQLALLGVTADVTSVNTSSGKTIYRVQSTRVDSAGRAQELSQRLKSNGIETMIRQAD